MSMDGGSVPPPRESFARRYKYVWPLLLTAVGGYLFLRTKKKDIDPASKVIAAEPGSASAASVTMEKPVSSTMVTEPVVIRAREPAIPEMQQRALFKWILEEKRKVKPRNAEERKKIDEEKAILKHFIGSKTIPTL